MFQLSKLILQKTKPHIVFLVVASSVVFVIIVLIQEPFCGFEHLLITSDLAYYEQTLDPEFCESLVNRIDYFNEDCEPYVEILDCG